MRRLLVLLGVAGALGLPLPAADASCAGPGLFVVGMTADPVRLVPGSAVDVVGTFFAQPTDDDDGCHDTGPPPGDGGCDDGPAPAVPRRGVVLDLVVAGRSERLAVADADDRFEVRWHAVVPVGARPGPAELVTDRATLAVVITAPR